MELRRRERSTAATPLRASTPTQQLRASMTASVRASASTQLRASVTVTTNVASLPVSTKRPVVSLTDDKENRSLTSTPNAPTPSTPGSSTPGSSTSAAKRPLERIYESTLDATGAVTKSSYLKGRFLGKGGFASCYEVVCERSSRKYACKVVTKRSLSKPKARAKFKSEIQIHTSLRHVNVVQFERYFEDDQNAYLLLELCRNQSLSDLLRRRKRLSEAEVRFYLRQLIDGLAYLHKELVIHRDLKLGNLFLTADMKLKIGDFGLAARLDSPLDRKRTLCGTPNYIAPEILTGRATTGHSFEVDVWSTGVVMYTLLVGKPPFETSDVKETYKRIRVGEFSFPPEVEVSESAKSVMRHILRVDPKQRPSLDAILAHPFFADRPTLASLPKTALLITPPECKRVLASNKRNMDARSYEQPPRYPLRRRDVNSTRDRERVLPAATAATATAASKAVVAPTKPVELYHTPPPQDGGNLQTTLIMAGSSSSSHASDKSRRSKKSLTSKMSTGHDASRATTATSETPLPTTTTRGDEDDNDAKDPFELVQETLSRFFFLEEHVNNHDDQLDEFSSASVIVAAAKRVKEIRLEQEAAHAEPLVSGTLWLSQWVDYTSKYGMGYVLSDGSSGVYFNDSTKMIASADNAALEYIERVAELSAAPEPFVRYAIDTYDASLKKKVTLLTHFKSYLIDEREKKPEIEAFEKEARGLGKSSGQATTTANGRMVYVKKWVKTKHAVLFFLSNHTFQFNFYDSSKFILSPNGRVVTYMDKEGKLGVYSTAVAILNREPSDLMKRLRYARDMFEQIARVNATVAAQGDAEACHQD